MKKFMKKTILLILILALFAALIMQLKYKVIAHNSINIANNNLNKSNNSNGDNDNINNNMNAYIDDKTPVGLHGQLQVDGKHIKDKDGNIFQIRGVSTHGIGLNRNYQKYVNQEAFEYMRDEWKINTVRLTLYTPPDCGNNSTSHEIVKQGVEYAKNAGLYAIIDWHVLKEGDPNTYKTEAIEYFKMMANLYKDYPNVIYEICNEPHDVTWESAIKPYAEEVISEIRKIDDNAIIIVGTPNYSHGINIAVEDPITGYDNLVYSYHFYAATNKEKDITKLENVLDRGLPVLISECGMVSANGDGTVDTDSAKAWMNILNKNNIGFVVWQLTNKDEGSSLIKSDVTKLSDWTYEELSEHGKWLVDTLKKYSDETTEKEAEEAEKIQEAQYNIKIKENSNYTLKNKFIIGIQERTAVKELLERIDSEENIKVFDQDDKEAKGYVGTGMKLRIGNENSEDAKEIILVVKGDVSGDGKLSVSDLSEVNHAVLENITLKNEFKAAADIDENDEITITDLSEINHMIIY